MSAPSAEQAAAADELAIEQAHVDRVYAEVAKAITRADDLAAHALAGGRTDRTGVVGLEEHGALFERDAMMFRAGMRRQSLEHQYEGLVFGRLDMAVGVAPDEAALDDLEPRYIGRLGIRDDDYEPLVIDWRAPAASPFYRATPVDPQGVVRRRVLRCQQEKVVGVEDDLMVPEAPEGLAVVGDGALMAALSRSRGGRMRDIVATIQAHQDEAIRAAAKGVTQITGGPGTGKTVVALHRAAYLLYSDRRKYESGGILVVGPSAAYTAYIERVLPSLGENTVTLRSVGDVVEGMTGLRQDTPEAAAVKGSLSIRSALQAAVRDAAPGAPERFEGFVAGEAIRILGPELASIRKAVLRSHQRNLGFSQARALLAEAAFAQTEGVEKAAFLDRFEDSGDVDAFMREWWAPVDPREVLLWFADAERAGRYCRNLSREGTAALVASMQEALATGTWAIADAALVDDLAAKLGPMQELPPEDQGFYQIEELEDHERYGVIGLTRGRDGVAPRPVSLRSSQDRLLYGKVAAPEEYAHVLVDEAQDLSPMQWRMIGRRGRYASWTVVGDAAQASWTSQAEAEEARDEAFGKLARKTFHMTTNYRNAREVFDYAADVIRAAVPDADIPDAVRETGVDPVVRTVAPDAVAAAARESVEALLGEVEGAIAVVVPGRWAALESLAELDPRVGVIDPLSVKGLEYDATVIVDPDEITASSPGGVRVLYVALTRAAHRMHVVNVR